MESKPPAKKEGAMTGKQSNAQFSIGQQIYFPGNRRVAEALCTITGVDKECLHLVHAIKGRSKVRRHLYGKVFFMSRADYMLGPANRTPKEEKK
jgi:hypothetical protein